MATGSRNLSQAKNVIIVGAGFGGLRAANALSGRSDISVKVIDRRNYHLFQPLLYQVATAALSPADIAVPIRGELADQENCEVILDNVTKIDAIANVVFTDHGHYNFDFLVLACGSNHSYFGKSEWEENAPGLKTLEQATELRRRILSAFEEAESETDLTKQNALMTFVIVGGGPTGVEMAGAIAEISKNTLEKDFRHIDPTRTRVILIDAGPRILAGFHEDLSAAALTSLEKMGVQVWTNRRVTDVTAFGVAMGQEFISAHTVMWAAGVMASSLGRTLNTPLDGLGRVVVTPELHIKENKNIFVIGDMAAFETSNGDFLPGLAPVAMQQGRFVVKQIIRSLRGEPLESFKYLDKGQMATIGRSHAVLQFKNLKMAGFWAWMAWLFVHIYYLAGFKNKFFVFLQWTWSYCSFKRGARLILHKEWKTSNLKKLSEEGRL